MKFPCNNCLLIPLCRHKEYTIIMEGCSTICNLLYNFNVPDSRYRKDNWESNVKELESTLKPTSWSVESDVYYSGHGKHKKVSRLVRIQGKFQSVLTRQK